jgi:hypothetical protein
MYPRKSQTFTATPAKPGELLSLFSYKGPVSPTRPLPRVKLDLTADEHVVLPPATIEIFHPYSDVPAEGIEVLAYDYVEAFAEKFRALAERTRPRDLYDVVNLYRNTDARPEQHQFIEVLRAKCAFKGIQVPELTDIVRHRGDLEAGWASMLNHQLPASYPRACYCASLRRSRPGPDRNHPLCSREPAARRNRLPGPERQALDARHRGIFLTPIAGRRCSIDGGARGRRSAAQLPRR